MNLFERIKTGRTPYLAIIALWLFFVLPAVTQSGYFYIDDPDQLVVAELGPWWSAPAPSIGRHLPVFNLYRKLVYCLAGPTPAAFYFAQSGLILLTWVGLLWIVRTTTRRDAPAQAVLLLCLVGGSLAETAFTLGKHEPLLGLLMTGFIVVTVLHFKATNARQRAGTAGLLGLIAALATWNKETAMILPMIPSVTGMLESHEDQAPRKSLFARIKTATPATLAALAGVLIAKVPMFLASRSAPPDSSGTYTKYRITWDLISGNLIYYLKQNPEVYVVPALGLLLVVVAFLSKSRARPAGLATACCLTGLAYLAGLSLWRFSIPYYLYPVSLLGSLGLALAMNGITSKRIGRYLGIPLLLAVLLPIQAVVICQNLYLANSQRMATHASQTAFESLLAEIPPETAARVFLMNFPNPSEPPAQFENMLARHYGRNIECFGALNLSEKTTANETSALFHNQKSTPIPQPGDYLVSFPSEMTGPWHLRAVSPSAWNNRAAESLMLDTVVIRSEQRRITLPILSWRTLPHLREIRFGVEIRRVTSSARAGTWSGKWTDGWVGSKAGFSPFVDRASSALVRVTAFAPTVPNEVTILRGSVPVRHLILNDNTAHEVAVPEGTGPLHFHFNKAVSPKSIGMNEDTREISGTVELLPTNTMPTNR